MITIIEACAPWKPAPQRLDAAHWSVQIPNGWMRFKTPDYEMLSKDGPYLQYVLIHARPVDHPFRFTHRKIDPRMLPHEAAQVIVANLSADPKIKNFALVSSEPTTIDSILGFKLVYAYTDTQGVDIQAIYYGAIVDHIFFNLRYTAARRHYFSKDLAEFEQIQRSLHLRPAS